MRRESKSTQGVPVQAIDSNGVDRSRRSFIRGYYLCRRSRFIKAAY